jgi:hypothetical protein
MEAGGVQALLVGQVHGSFGVLYTVKSHKPPWPEKGLQALSTRHRGNSS